MNGVVIVRKEKGMTSFGVVARLRRIFDMKKIGHTGTLDPDAEGVLPVCLGRATHLVERLSRGTKEYRAVMRLGVTTDTQDTGGQVLSESPVSVTAQEAEEVLSSFRGRISQLPPMYSAVKVGGRKLVDLARRGIEVERSEREVEILEMEVLSADMPEITFRVVCSHGTYIRTLCHDAGQKLGCGAAMKELMRTRVGDFSLEDALTLGEIEARYAAGDRSFIRPIDSFFTDFPEAVVRPEAMRAAVNGGAVREGDWQSEAEIPGGSSARVYAPDGALIGIYRRKGNRLELEQYYYEDH